MAITNYDELKKEFEDWMHRDDLGVKFDTFLKLAEIEMSANPDEALKILSLNTIVELTTSTTSRFLSLPDNMNSQGKITVEFMEYDLRIQYVSPFNLKVTEAYSSTPYQYTISNNQIEFNCLPDKEYTVKILYDMQDASLSDDNQTNVILTRYPNIYLYGCLSQGFSYTQEDQQAQKYAGYFLQAIRDANKRERGIKYPTGLSVKSPRVV